MKVNKRIVEKRLEELENETQIKIEGSPLVSNKLFLTNKNKIKIEKRKKKINIKINIYKPTIKLYIY